MIYLVESFYSIQGEGRYTGVPSIFFRFGGCNMSCKGFGCQEIASDGTIVHGCDTIYAVNRQHYANTWEEIQTSTQLLDILDSYDVGSSVDIILTGGEPLIYATEDIFVEFLQELHRRDFTKYPIYKECVFALSVKLSNSGESSPWHPTLQRHFLSLA